MKKTSLISFGLAVVLLSSGCASVRVKTDLVPETDVTLKSPAGTFYIAGLKYDYLPILTGHTKPFPDLDYEKKLLCLLQKECLAQYPLLFSEQDKSAIPLFVTLHDVITEHRLEAIAWHYCTLMIGGTILPIPWRKDRNLTVSASLRNEAEGQPRDAVQKNFSRKERAWVTFLTPLGLLTVPGDSDFPKESGAFAEGRSMYNDAPQIAQQVATALAKMIESKDPEFWKAAPLRTQQPGYAPTTPLNTPPILPPPSETVTPF